MAKTDARCPQAQDALAVEALCSHWYQTIPPQQHRPCRLSTLHSACFYVRASSVNLSLMLYRCELSYRVQQVALEKHAKFPRHPNCCYFPKNHDCSECLPCRHPMIHPTRSCPTHHHFLLPSPFLHMMQPECTTTSYHSGPLTQTARFPHDAPRDVDLTPYGFIVYTTLTTLHTEVYNYTAHRCL